MKEKLKKLRSFIKSNCYEGWQAFPTRNTIGDTMFTIYCMDNVIVDICYEYSYLEIFGLTEDEFESLSDILNI